jgi:hypothetical protein
MSFQFYPFLFILFVLILMDALNSIPICSFTTPTSISLGPPPSIEPILAPSYELCPCFINMICGQSFSGEGDANPHSHLRKFEETCACLCITGMSNETLRWKLFLFSLMGKAKKWYDQTVGSVQGEWEMLCS